MTVIPVRYRRLGGLFFVIPQTEKRKNRGDHYIRINGKSTIKCVGENPRLNQAKSRYTKDIEGDLAFGIEPCHIDDGGANRLPDNLSRDHYDIKSKDLVRFVFQSCGWKKKLTYRVPGVLLAPDSHKVCFDLRQALEVHEGRTKPAY